MKQFNKISSMAAMMIAMFSVVSTANAQNGGRPGGGGGTVESGIPLTISEAISVNGKVPAWSGTYTLTHATPAYYSFDSIQVSIKGKPLNLPDGSILHVTYYFSDTISGLALPAVNAPNLVCLKGTGTAKSAMALQNPAYTNMYRHLDEVVVWANDGTVVLVAHG